VIGLRAAVDALWMSGPGLRAQDTLKWWRRRLRFASTTKRAGHCPLCEQATHFVVISDNHRESPICLGCGSVPRQRALAKVVRARFAELTKVRVHESSPSLCTYLFFARHTREYRASYYWPGLTRRNVGVFANVDLRAQPFAAASFDLVVTQDVLEHVPEPMLALREIERTLCPGGVHIFTVPRMDHCDTSPRARLTATGFEHLQPPEYHRDPISRAGTLVVTDWGRDLEALVAAGTSCTCGAEWVCDPQMGIDAPIELFVVQRR
jgi:SAM-dependent methyltransferase